MIHIPKNSFGVECTIPFYKFDRECIDRRTYTFDIKVNDE